VLRSDGSLARWLPGPRIDPAALTVALEQARGEPSKPLPEQLFLLCYHLVSAAKAHDRLVLGVLQIVGMGSALVLLLGVGALVLGDRRGRARP
jgi:hypothetical protein